MTLFYKIVREIQSGENGEIYPIHYVLNWVLKGKTQKWFFCPSHLFYMNSLNKTRRYFYIKVHEAKSA